MKTLVLGAGNMISAILEGLYGEKDLSNFYIYSPSGHKAQALAEKVGAKWVDDLRNFNDPEFVWLGFKPQQIKSSSHLIKDNFKKATFVSFLAAISEDDQKHILGVDKLIRVMPNLNVKIKKGICLASTKSSQVDLLFFENLFKPLGKFLIVEENELDELTLLTGSGPALIYEFAKCLADSFVSLDESSRELLMKNLLSGASEMAMKSSESFDHLINAVTSKGGVTIAVLENWRKNGLENIVESGVRAGESRRIEMSKEINLA
jgi:pyrroline-5-carboxylate reductase